jgi:hypothetical protein
VGLANVNREHRAQLPVIVTFDGSLGGFSKPLGIVTLLPPAAAVPDGSAEVAPWLLRHPIDHRQKGHGTGFAFEALAIERFGRFGWRFGIAFAFAFAFTHALQRRWRRFGIAFALAPSLGIGFAFAHANPIPRVSTVDPRVAPAAPLGVSTLLVIGAAGLALDFLLRFFCLEPEAATRGTNTGTGAVRVSMPAEGT